ncbi:dienelactone hydrolase family protein [Janibacter sp. G368]|uniref:dienelactone hydrolase family protein n=1 Tax=Janibacter sp. G368 TaxID=3420441 RepID=UPI003D0290BC
MADDPLTDFTREGFDHEGTDHTVLRSGTGPAVVVIAEFPGITPQVAAFARRVRDLGCTVVLPDLFGVAGRDALAGSSLRIAAGGVRTAMQVCVSREFSLLALGRTSPVIPWLRALARAEHARCGGPGVGAVGMCLTGGFALAMATDESVLAPVLSQPSLPLPVGRRRRETTDISEEDLAIVEQRCAAGLQVLGVRFEGDRLSPGSRFATLRRRLGDAFVVVELPDDSANPDGFGAPHSVLTTHLVDREGEPTRAALDEVLDLFRQRLLRRPS